MTTEQRGSRGLSVSVITVAFGNPELVHESAKSALGAGATEVIIWDNTQVPAEAAQIKGLETIGVKVYSDGTNRGFGSACNMAAELTSGSYLLFLNPDCIINREALASCLDLLCARSDVGIVAPRMVYPDGTFGIAGGGAPSLTKEIVAATGIDDILPRRARTLAMAMFERILSRSRSGTMAASMSPGGPLEVFWVSGFCMLVRRAEFIAAGGFDTRFFLYFEDADICYRFRESGRKVLVNRSASVLHLESASTGGQKSSFYWKGLETFWSVRGRTFRVRLTRVIWTRFLSRGGRTR